MMLRTKICLLALLFLTSSKLLAQETFIIEGDTLQVQQEVYGTINLFWTPLERDYRYFVQKKKRMVELKDTVVNGIPQYQKELDTLTSDAEINTGNVRFTLESLKDFIKQYNSGMKESAASEESASKLRQRVGFFTGISNSVYVANPENALVPILGASFELDYPELAPRHSALLQLRHSFRQTEFSYTSTELSLNYRFKFLRVSNISFHIETELATLVYSEDEVEVLNSSGEIVEVREEDGFSVKVPLNFGIGGDLKITDNGYITFGYNDVISIFQDSNGSFPIDFSLGYKYDL